MKMKHHFNYVYVVCAIAMNNTHKIFVANEYNVPIRICMYTVNHLLFNKMKIHKI